MRRVSVIGGALVLVLGLAAPALATNGYQLIGVGQNQKGMAGAVTAAPMDTMTAISNPAGMARVGERADFSMEAFMPKRSVDFTSPAFGTTPGSRGESTEGGSELYGIPSVGWVANAFNRDNFYFGGGMFATSGMGVDYDEIPFAEAGSFGAHPDLTFTGYSQIQFWKMAPTVAWNQSDNLSLGVSLNLDYQSLTFAQSIKVAGSASDMFNLDLGRPTSQLGYGAGFGALYDVSPTVTLGFNYNTKQTFGDATYRLAEGDIDTTLQAGVPTVWPGGKYKMGVDYPQQAALGVSVTPNDALLVAFDVKWIDWSSTHGNINLSGPGGSLPLTFGWDDQIVYALGVQYVATDKLKLRTGFNYAESPIGPEDVFNNMIFPAIVEKHFTLGVDYALGEHWGVGGAYMKAFKNDVTNTDPAFPAPAIITLEETSVGISLSYLF